MTVNQFKSKSKENATGNQKQSSRGVLENFVKFTGKHLCQSLFFSKVFFRPPVDASRIYVCKQA